MPLSRYVSDNLINDGKLLGTNGSLQRIRDAVAAGRVSTTTIVIKESDRLDAIAGRFYGDGRLWWVIAAASGIGWWLQVPPGTRVVIPTDLSTIEGLI
jgi:nucleoid-associated protein YgaU